MFERHAMSEKQASIRGLVRLVRRQNSIVLDDSTHPLIQGEELIASLDLPSEYELGDRGFQQDYGVRLSCYAGAMANGISSPEMVIALAQQQLLGFLGAGGLSVKRITDAVQTIKARVSGQTFGVNLLHNPANPQWEMDCVQLLLDEQVRVAEASAYIQLTEALVYYRVAGLCWDEKGQVRIQNRLIAKVSRREVAQNFMKPAPAKLLEKLLAKQLITQEQAQLAQRVPMADDITVEGDSGGHTDQGTLTCIFASIMALRDELAAAQPEFPPVRLGAAGGLGTPSSVRAAFAMGAAYIVTGSINQACVEAGTSAQVKQLLGRLGLDDVAMAPSADMFEIGAKVQVVRKGSMYAVRAQKLYSLYKQYDAIEAIPEAEIQLLEKQLFRQPIETIWQQTQAFFKQRQQSERITQACQQPKKKMALIFQWYLGQSSRWAIEQNADRVIDYQIWCGPAMGAMNEWLKGSKYEDVSQRKVADITFVLMRSAASLMRAELLANLHINAVQTSEHIMCDSEAPEADINDEFQADVSLSSQSTVRSQETMGNDTKLNLELSKDFYKKCWDVLPGGTHYNFGDPERPLVIPFNKGRNSRVWDLDGNEHIDLFCKFGALIMGHHNEAYDQKLIDYMQKVTSVDTCDLEVDVCETLIRHIPCAEMIRFCLSGTEAVQNALRLARGFTGKTRFIRFHGHYHGNADNIMGWHKKEDLSFPVPEQFKGDMLDTLGRAPNIMVDQSFVLPWNDIDILTATIERYHGEIAAVLMEPLCINGGGIFPKEGYLEKAKALCEKYNVVLIFDEIITGVRVGLGGVQELLGVTPHLATFGKALAGGSMPVSAIAGRRDIMDLYTRGKVIHAGTFNGYPLGLAAVKATYDLIEQDPGCYERMSDVMRQISGVFVKAAEAVDLPLVVQGMPTALVYHSQSTPVESSEGYSDRVKFCDIIIREISKRYGIQFSPLSRIYSNVLMSEDDVRFFEERIFDAMENARKIIDITFKEGVEA